MWGQAVHWLWIEAVVLIEAPVDQVSSAMATDLVDSALENVVHSVERIEWAETLSLSLVGHPWRSYIRLPDAYYIFLCMFFFLEFWQIRRCNRGSAEHSSRSAGS